MKSIILSVILLALVLTMQATDKAPYKVNLNSMLMDDYQNREDIPNAYREISSVELKEALPEKTINSGKPMYDNHYYIENKKIYFVELRDSTDRVLWRREMLKTNSGRDAQNQDDSYSQNNPEIPFVRGVYLETDGTALLADSTLSRYYLMDKAGNKTFLPYGTVGMTSRGWIDKYWLLTYGLSMRDEIQDMYSEYYETPKQTYMPYYRFFALFNKNGSLYKSADLSSYENISNLQIDSHAQYCWFEWERRSLGNDESVYVDEGIDQNSKNGMTLMTLDGKIIISREMQDIENGYYTEADWSGKDSEFFVLKGDNNLWVYEAATGKMLINFDTARTNHSENYYNLLAMADEKSGIAFLTYLSNLVVVDYINNRILAYIGNVNPWGEEFELLKPDGSQFSVINKKHKSIYALKK